MIRAPLPHGIGPLRYRSSSMKGQVSPSPSRSAMASPQQQEIARSSLREKIGPFVESGSRRDPDLHDPATITSL